MVSISSKRKSVSLIYSPSCKNKDTLYALLHTRQYLSKLSFLSLCIKGIHQFLRVKGNQKFLMCLCHKHHKTIYRFFYLSSLPPYRPIEGFEFVCINHIGVTMLNMLILYHVCSYRLPRLLYGIEAGLRFHKHSLVGCSLSFEILLYSLSFSHEA